MKNETKESQEIQKVPEIHLVKESYGYAVMLGEQELAFIDTYYWNEDTIRFLFWNRLKRDHDQSNPPDFASIVKKDGEAYMEDFA